MTSDHPRVLSVALAIAFGLAAGVAAETIAGTDLETADLVADLPWSFEVTVEPATGDDSPLQVTRYRFKSTAPIERTAAGAVYLRAELTALEHANAGSAEAAFEELLAGADPDTGLSYAWDQLLLSGALVFRRHAGCTFSEESFRRVAERLEGAVQRLTEADLRVAACRCGGGCREVSATPPSPAPRKEGAHGF